MLPHKTLQNVKKVYGLLSYFGSIPYKCSSDRESSFLQSVPTNTSRSFHHKMVILVTFFHCTFISVRLIQAYLSPHRKFFLVFMHYIWSATFLMVSWLHGTLFMCQDQVKAYCNGLFKFYGSFGSMPGERFSAKERRRRRKKPTLIDLLILSFLIGAVLNTLMTVEMFLLFKESYQFAYSTIPPCWKERSPYIIIPFVIYEFALPGINWTLLIFFIIIHLVHLFSTRDYLLILRKNTRNGILKVDDLLHHYRSIQILHNHYNQWIASFMSPELFVIASLTLAANIGTLRTFHLSGHVSIAEFTLLPLVSVLCGAFQMIFYQHAGDLHHVSSYFSTGAAKPLFKGGKLAKSYLKSFPPLSVEVGNVLKIRKFTVVRFVGGIVVGTARLSVLFFKWKVIQSNG